MAMHTCSQVHHGQWRHPDDRHADFDDVRMWIKLARRLEEGLFDFLFFADVVGLYGAADGSYEVNAKEGLQFPNLDPAVLMAALAVNTEHLGLAYTSSTLQVHPFHFARQISTIDQMSGGRVAWNIVTGILEQAVRNFNFQEMTPRAERYKWAQEFCDVCYKLWEGSWEDGALLRDRAKGIFSDASKIHKIYHRGERYRVDGPHLTAPTPQRTPFLFQAGASRDGQAFAARNAEAVFLVPPTLEAAQASSREIRELAVAAGRRPEDILCFYGTAFVIGSTEDEARRKEKEFEEYMSIDGYVAQMLSAAGISARSYPPDTPLSQIETDVGSVGLLSWLKQSVHGREPVVADAAALLSGQRIVGTPETIADRFEELQNVGMDGIMVWNWRIPGCYDDFIDHVMPVLRKRGLAQTEYQAGTLRRKLTGNDYLNDRHQARKYRNAFGKQK
jgi:FMN-dependent oxidoreductase (nitrilotriacetate monooxygenase family)